MRLDFVNPEYLWFLLSIPLLIITHFYFLHHARAKGLKFANFEVLRRVTGKELITKNIPILILRCLVLILVIFAAADVELWYVGESNQNDYVLALDISLSMTTADVPPNRLEASKVLATEFVNQVGGDASIGVVSFSGITFVNQALGSDKAHTIRAIRDLRPNDMGGTDISGALITATNLLLSSKKGKVIVLMSDGSHTGGAENAIREALEYVKANHIQVHTLAVGTERGLVPYLPPGYNMTAIFNREILKEIAETMQGLYLDASTGEAIGEAKKKLSGEVEMGLLHKELSYIFILVALTLLFVEWGLLNTRFRRIP